VHKRFGEEISINYYGNEPAAECSLIKEFTIELGVLDDWRKLSGFHYRSHNAGAVRKIFCLWCHGELCGVIVYCYPPPNCSGRGLVLPRMPIKELNAKLSIISRIVVHPKYRSIGLGAKLIRDTLPRVGTPSVEMVAVMAKYNPFAEKAGMQKVAVQTPSKEAVKIRDLLEEVGFDIQFLNSRKHVQERLSRLDQNDILKIKAAFMKYKHPRFLKTFTSHVPFGQKEIYERRVADASLERLGDLIRTCSFLLQTKVYLFWRRGRVSRVISNGQ
jgi:GNAT superfamily N-acetyltransferase